MSMGHFNGKVGNAHAPYVSRGRAVGGHPKPHICNQRSQFCLYNFYGATMTIKGSLVYMENPPF